MEILVRREALRQQLGADDLAVLEDEATGSLTGEDHARDAGDEEGIAEAEHNGSDEGEQD